MKMAAKWLLAFLVVCSLAVLPVVKPARAQVGGGPALLQPPSGDRFVLGGTFTLGEGEVLAGDLFMFGGSASLEAGSLVEESVVLLGGALQADGTIRGDVTAVGGSINLGETAVVEGDINATAAQVNREPGAQVLGRVNVGSQGPIQVDIPGWFRTPVEGVRVPELRVTVSPFLSAAWLLFRSLLWAAVAALVALFLPKPLARMGRTIGGQPLVSFGLGLFTLLVLPLLLALVAITIIGIPLSLLGGLVLVVTWALGVIALGAETGRRLAALFRWDWALPLSAAFGAFLVTLVVNGINHVIPCIGVLVMLAAGALGVGAILLTRYGSHDYPERDPLAASPS